MYHNRQIRIKLTPSIVLKRIILLVGIFFFLFILESSAQISTRKLEAIYMYNFTKYINWQDKDGSFVIGVLGERAIANELSENLKGKLVNNNPIEIKNISIVAEVGQCHILYLPKSKSRDLENVISTINNGNVLIVSEDDLASEGATVSFFIDGSKLRFKINQDALNKAGLQASSSLLSLAVII